MIRIARVAPLWMLLVLSAACSSHTGTWDITVTNKLPDAVTIWLTKAKGPYQGGWEPPEVAAVGNTVSHRLGGAIVDAGQTVHTRITRKIESDNVAVLRIYRTTDVNAMLAMSRPNPNRIDVPMDPGFIDIDIVAGPQNKLGIISHGPERVEAR